MALIATRPIHFKQSDQRSIDERLQLRFPGLSSRVADLVLSRPRTSRLRRAVIARAVAIGMSALNRMDFESLFVRYDPDCVVTWRPELTPIDLDSEMRGHDALRRSTMEAQGAWNVVYKPTRLLDAGNWFIVTTEMSVSGGMTGMELGTEVAFLYTTKKGLVMTQSQFPNVDAALEAAQKL